MGHSKRYGLHLLAAIVLSPLLSASAQTYLYNQASLGTGAGPTGIVVADLNGDGQMDLAVANQSDNTVSVILSASGRFDARVDYEVGASPVALAEADFNGDHIPDIAVVNSVDNTVSILLGTGNGAFASATPYSTDATPVAIVSADLNADGKMDLAVINQSANSISVLLGNGDGSFTSASTISLPSMPLGLVTGDFNGDGLWDLAVLVSGTNGPEVLVFQNGGNGSFSSKTFETVALATTIARGDFDGDGNPDLIVVSQQGQYIIFRGDGTGNFGPISGQLTFNPVGLTTGDFNNDGKSDLLAGSGTGFPNPIEIVLGNGDGTFQSPHTTGFPAPGATVAADFNNDNYIDAAVLDLANHMVTILLGNGQGDVGTHMEISLPAHAAIAGSATADFTGDGKTDVALAQYDQDSQGVTGVVTVLPGNGDGTFQSAISTPVSNIGIGQLVIGDFNGDGKMDVATGFVPATGNISVVLGNADGTFGAPVSNPVTIPGLTTQYLVGGDFNNDGRADLALLSSGCANACSPLYALTSNGDGTFQAHHVYDIPSIALDLATADFNHDGKMDIAVAGEVANQVFVFLGNGDGSFRTPTSYSTQPSFAYSVTPGDFNGDGKMDMVVGTDQGAFFYAGNGDGTFQSPIKTLTLLMPVEDSFAEDFNGDGKLDLAVDGLVQGQSLMLGNGDGTFQAPVPFEPNFRQGVRYFPRADYNGDGTEDFMLFSRPNSVQGATVFVSRAVAGFSTSAIFFAPENIGNSSPPASVLLRNLGNSPMLISNVTSSGSFSQTNNCGASLGIGESCTASVIFSPTATGLSSGSLLFTDSADPGKQSIVLTGWSGPPDFVISAPTDSASVTAGGTAKYLLTLTAGGGFSGTVQLACSGEPSKAVCNVLKTPVVVAGTSSAIVTVTVSTTASTSQIGKAAGFSGGGFPWVIASLCFGVAALWCVPVKKLRGAEMAAATVLLFLAISCGGSSGNSGGGGGGGTLGTPPGTYTLTVTGTSATSTHTMNLILTVK